MIQLAQKTRMNASLWGLVLLTIASYSYAAKSLPILMLGVVGVVSSWLLVGARGGKPIPRIIINLSVFILVIWLFKNYNGLNETILELMADFLACLIILKLFDYQRIRDWVQMVMLSLFLMMCGSILSTSLFFGTLFIIYIIWSMIVLMQIQIYHAATYANTSHSVTRSETVHTRSNQSLSPLFIAKKSRRYFIVIVLFAFFTASGMASVVFFLAPRHADNPNASEWQSIIGQPTTGFSQQVKLGGDSTIQEDNTPVLNVKLTKNNIEIGDIGKTFHLRGMVLDTYRRQLWRRSRQVEEFDSATNVERDPSVLSVPIDAEITTMQITSRTRFGKVLFTGDNPARLHINSRGVVVFNPLDNVIRLRFNKNARDLQSYEVDVLSRSESDLRENYINKWVSRSSPNSKRPDEALRVSLPRNPVINSPQLNQFVNQILSDANIPNTQPALPQEHWEAAANAIQSRIEDECLYTLDQPDIDYGKEPITEFLFTHKKGHCEYFASALCASLRSLYIPSRVVTGYHVSEYNPIGGYYVVRNKDAHAWVEVFLPDKGWTVYDPSPRQDYLAIRQEQEGILSRINQLYDAAEFFWVGNIIAYDIPHQEDIYESLNDWVTVTTSSFQNWFFDSPSENATQDTAKFSGSKLNYARTSYVVIASMLIILGIGFLIHRKIERGKISRALGLDPDSHDSDLIEHLHFYYNTLKLLAHHGHHKPAEITPQAFAKQLTAQDQQKFNSLYLLTQIYYKIRYGDHSLEPQTHQAIDQAYTSLKQNLR